MRKLLVAAALAPACLLLTAAAPAQDVLDQLTDKAKELFGEKGLTPTGWVSNGSLAQGGTKTVSVTLNNGVSSIVGMCDTDCGDLNLVIKDAKGNELDSDLEDDDFPILVTNQGGAATITITMVACKSSNCRYRLVGFKK